MKATHGNDTDPVPGDSSLPDRIRAWGHELGFQAVGFCDTDLSAHEPHLESWLDQGMHGEMAWMARHGRRRSRPEQLVPGTISVISARMDYWPGTATPLDDVMSQTDSGLVSRYALGRDYHKVLRSRLQKLATRIESEVGPFGYRVFTDSAPVLEKALAEKAGLGWIGKHSNLLSREAGSWFFIGEIYTDLPLPPDEPGTNHCGECRRCLDICPTQAIVGPYRVDARRCISYLTIELRGSIPVEYRQAMGNRIYGCDDCQAVCPWNRFAQASEEEDFQPRQGLDAPDLVDLFGWDEATFLSRTAGSAIRRIGYECWLRNIAVALGNAPTTRAVVGALKARSDDPSPLVREHVAWALKRHA
ncbi:MAG: tRNA epoxyqueuosine(34) reductase QueG [Xanthomonadales bacterium]|nr:tRNA epoxyqueuosine(34) reductase QueG [Xanthomonadales bacterium]